MTAEKAISYFINLINKKEKYKLEDVKKVLDKIDIEDEIAADDALTVLYSGEGDVKNQLLNAGSKVRMIDRTEAAKFINDKAFRDIIEFAILKDSSVADYNTFENEYLYCVDPDKGFWASISKRFASETKGDVYALVQHSVPNRICEKVEIPTILDADSIPITAKINGKTKDINHERY